MQKFILILLGFFLLFHAVPTLAQATNQSSTNQATTNQMASATNTNLAPQPSDPQLQAEAKDVMRKVMIFGAIVLLGAVVVACFALYGAYRKFGVVGVIIVAVILTIAAFLFLGFLLIL
jgi:uncharacterized membrane protein